MASVSTSANGTRKVQFTAPDGNRKTIYLGQINRKGADAIARHIEALCSAKVSGQSLTRDTAAWLSETGEALRGKLAALGLIAAPKRANLGEFLREYILARPDVKPATLEVWAQPVRNLIEFFKDDKPLRNITAGDADQFKAWLLTQGLAPATLAKRLAFARTFFHTARKHRLIDENPFAEVKIPSASVSHRQEFVDRAKMQRLMDMATPTWRIIIALARLGGLRCPSEVLSLQWTHIDWKAATITVPSPKTDRYADKDTRTIPLFADLRPYLLEAQELAAEGQTHVVGGNHLAKANGPTGWKNCNLRTSFRKLIKRAGLTEWPRMFHNLRSSRETELLEQFPLHVVAGWMGHDAKVSLKHYAQTTDEHFDRATNIAQQDDALSDASKTITTHFSTQPDAATSRQIVPEQGRKMEIVGVLARTGETQHQLTKELSGEEGIRTAPKNPAKTALSDDGDSESDSPAQFQGAYDPELDRLISRWPDLSYDVRAQILRLAESEGEG